MPDCYISAGSRKEFIFGVELPVMPSPQIGAVVASEFPHKPREAQSTLHRGGGREELGMLRGGEGS